MEKKIIFIIIILFFLISFFNDIKSQEAKYFWKISRPEKCWILKHPFIAKKAFRLTQYVRQTTDSIKSSGILDKDADGGQVDAFRHSYWMALLSSNFHWRKIYRLGKAHEKGNYFDYKKKRLEDGSIPDEISSQMDMCNNIQGIKIASELKTYDRKIIRDAIIDSIKAGKMYVIKKNIDGHFLDKDNNIINPLNLKGKWKNNKCLVPSDYIKH